MSGGSFVVAIDGPAASGKGTLARGLAERFSLAHLDTGSLYRATAFLVLEAGGDPADAAAAERAARHVTPALLGDPRLRGEAVGAAASVVAAIAQVRRALLDFQRDFAAHPPAPPRGSRTRGPRTRGPRIRGAVLDGRDIGSVVCPQAQVKLFLTASLEARAARRLKELRERGEPAIYEAVLLDLKERDARDTLRHAAPLRAAPGAVTIDTTALDADRALESVSQLIARSLDAAR
ncbi:MAG TPA: (d)CMP kinase [Stellaceae bacterium]|nr:(d)CMP kinase [Stellaceae bacterium]